MRDVDPRGGIVPRCLVLAACAIAMTSPALGQSTVFRTRTAASSTWNPALRLTFGIGIDYEHGNEQKETAIPFLVEYNFSEWFRVTAETGFKFVDSTDPEVGKAEGLEDTETGLDYEFLHERRYTPSFTAVGLIKWPTATDADVGDPGTDISAGLTLAKDCVYFDLESNLIYKYTTAAELPDSVEFSLAWSYRVNYKWELQLEGTRTFGVSGPNKSDVDETEGTFGFTWQITPFQALESGVLYKNDGTWGISVGWQYSFAGE